MLYYFCRTLNTICINLPHQHLSDYFISANQNNKDGLKKATVEMKLKDRRNLIGKPNMWLSKHKHTRGGVEAGDSKSLLRRSQDPFNNQRWRNL